MPRKRVPPGDSLLRPFLYRLEIAALRAESGCGASRERAVDYAKRVLAELHALEIEAPKAVEQKAC